MAHHEDKVHFAADDFGNLAVIRLQYFPLLQDAGCTIGMFRQPPADEQ